MQLTTRFRAVAACALVLALCMSASVASATVLHQGKPAKYVFLFIGDGMGMPQKAAAEAFYGEKLIFDAFPGQGVTTTQANDRFIIGSAASATAIASGVTTNINYIGVDPNYKPVKTIAQMARDAGMKVGIVSSVSIDHATPAAFYAHQPTRKMYHEISVDLANSNFDFFGGGGIKDPMGKKSKAPKGDVMQMLKDNGYTVVDTRDGIMKLNGSSEKIVAIAPELQDSKSMKYVLDTDMSKDVTLAEFTQKAIDVLDNDKGFFLMVEGGKIDWACHANDTMGAITNTRMFEDSVKKAIAFARKHPDETAIIVTGDHECGGLTLGFAGTKYDTNFEVLRKQNISYLAMENILKDYKAKNSGSFRFDDMKPLVEKHYGLKFTGDADKDPMVLTAHEADFLKKAFMLSMGGEKESAPQSKFLYGYYDPLVIAINHTLANKAGLAWTSFSHTAVPVGTSAWGVGAQSFNGMYEQREIGMKLMAVMGFKPEVVYMVEKEADAMLAVR